MSWRELKPGVYIDKPGTSEVTKTGDWRTLTPVTDIDKCIKCGECWIFCPDNARFRREDSTYDSQLYWCKGCGICAQICPTHAIKMRE